MQILDHRQVTQKIRRLAIEVYERNCEEEALILAGINNNGMGFARMLAHELSQVGSTLPVTLTNLRLNPAAPDQSDVQLDLPLQDLHGKAIVVVDDVANTGRTIFYACKPLLGTLPKKVEVAVLVDRTHKSFPVKVDYIGLSLATTLREHIRVEIKAPTPYAVFLE